MQRYLLAIVSLGLVVAPALPADLFAKKPKPPAAEAPPPAGKPSDLERVQSLVSRLLLDKDASKREEAAEQLRHFDSQKFPELVTALIEAVQKDGDSDVRREAVKSLGKLRPPTAEGLQALEHAGKDSSYLVRFEARLARWGYKVPDSHSSSAAAPPAGATMIKVPPAGPDGRLKPVPIPEPAPAPALQTPVQEAPPRVSISRPIINPKDGDDPGPILVAPKK